MPPYYPVFLDLRGRPCVIIGGGAVAERKVEGFLECGARVTVVSPDLATNLERRASKAEIRWCRRDYVEGDLKGAFLVIAATDRADINHAVAQEAEREAVILNVVDQPALCTFIAPAILRRGDVTLAMSTGGASPALARKLREVLETSEALEYAVLAPILARARKEIQRRGVKVQPDTWQSAISLELVKLVNSGQAEEALTQLLTRLLDDSDG